MIADPVGVEETTDQMAWGDNFLEINGVWYSKRDTNYTRCNTCDKQHLNLANMPPYSLLSGDRGKFIIIFYFTNLTAQAPWVGLNALLRPLRSKLIKCHFQVGSDPFWEWVCEALDSQDAINELLSCAPRGFGQENGGRVWTAASQTIRHVAKLHGQAQ